MDLMPKVTVVVPTYNGAKFLAPTLQAVLKQTLKSVELLVVDDGSTDNTLEVVAAVAPTARVVQQRNSGVSAARNRGLALARGTYVIFLDQDDIWHPEMLELQAGWLDRHPEHDVVFLQCKHWFPSAEGAYAEPMSLWPPRVEGVLADYTGWIYHQLLVDCWALTSSTLMRCDAVRACGGFDESLPYSEDWDLWLRLSQTSQFAQLAWPPVLYRQHPVQGSRKPRKLDYRSNLLEAAVARWGLASKDGRFIGRAEFARQIAHYRFEFGYHHLHSGNRWIGIRALLVAWWRWPLRLRPLALSAAALMGWRPQPAR